MFHFRFNYASKAKLNFIIFVCIEILLQTSKINPYDNVNQPAYCTAFAATVHQKLKNFKHIDPGIR